MEKIEALDRLEYRVRHTCAEANGDSIGDCNKCWRYPCNDMKALLTLLKPSFDVESFKDRLAEARLVDVDDPYTVVCGIIDEMVGSEGGTDE